MIYSIGQLRTIVKHMEERNGQYVNTDAPPTELCRSFYWKKTKNGRDAWCGRLHCPCQMTNKGCYGYVVRETM